MFRRSCVALLSIPLTAQVLFVEPSSFHVSVGERIAVGLHGESLPRDVTVHTATLQYNVTNLRIKGDRVFGDARMPKQGTLVISAHTLPKVVTNRGRELSSQYAKALVRSGNGDDTYTKPLGFALELIAEVDPYSLKVGDRLPLRLLWKSKPASGVIISTDSDAIGRTDSEGRVYVTLTASGTWRLHAVARERCSDEQKADWESYWASLTFEIR